MGDLTVGPAYSDVSLKIDEGQASEAEQILHSTALGAVSSAAPQPDKHPAFFRFTTFVKNNDSDRCFRMTTMKVIESASVSAAE